MEAKYALQYGQYLPQPAFLDSDNKIPLDPEPKIYLGAGAVIKHFGLGKSGAGIFGFGKRGAGIILVTRSCLAALRNLPSITEKNHFDKPSCNGRYKLRPGSAWG